MDAHVGRPDAVCAASAETLAAPAFPDKLKADRLDSAGAACQSESDFAAAKQQVMLESLKTFLAELTGGTKQPERFAENDYRLAAAALLVHAATIDGSMSEAERDKLQAVLKRCFELDDATTAELIEEATAAEHEAVDLYGFTSSLNHRLDDEGRRRIVQMLWEVIYADGRLNEFEDNLVWRAADLLHVSSRDRLEIRRRVAGGRAELNDDD
jgi:uncharacterized tellurite resistance protein B-like protein